MLDCSQEEIIALAGYFAAVHDIGKCHPFFQQKGLDAETLKMLESFHLLQFDAFGGFRHEKYSEIVIKRLLKTKGLSTAALKMAAATLRLHHQGKNGDGTEPAGKMQSAFWQAQQDSLNKIMDDLFSPDLALLNRCRNMDCMGTLLSAVIILSDWLASGQNDFFALQDTDCLSDYAAIAERAAHSAIINCGLSEQKQLPAAGNFSTFWPGIPKESIRPVQITCEEICQHQAESLNGLYMIEAPMGEGKTEAAMYLAAHMMNAFGKNGLYVALPTSATSNQMHGRVVNLLEIHGIGKARLLHAAAWQLDNCTPSTKADTEDAEAAARWLAPLRRGMLSPYAVGTIDQAMLSVMSVKYGFLRLLGLAGKVLVLDEVHAYDAYMNKIIERLLEWCSVLHVPVILLSATLPVKKRQAFIKAYGGCNEPGCANDSYPLITSVGRDGAIFESAVGETFIKRNVEIRLLPLLGNWEAVAELATEKAAGGGCLCLIVNTVKEAQKLYLAIKERIPDYPDIWLRLFHARFTADARKAVEEECIAAFGKVDSDKPSVRPQKAILVASQVVEQSLDIDFDEMITAIAPIDLLLQRMGRLHRHGDRERPQGMLHPRLTVLTPKDNGDYGGTQYVYVPWILNKTLEMLERIDDIHVPGDLRRLVEAVYGAESPDADSEEFRQWYEMVYDEQFKMGMAENSLLPPPDADSFFCTQRPMQLFDDEGKDENYTTARTRLGEDTAKVAFLDGPLFDEISARQAINGFPGRELAQKALWRSVSLNAKLVSGKAVAGYFPPLEGRGLLKGVILLKTVDRRYSFETNGGTVTLLEDEDLGIVVERGNDRG
jgi:CRISPR-associated endonuclease/helicase Cas3